MSGVQVTASEGTNPEERERERVAWNLPRPAIAPTPASSEPEDAPAAPRAAEQSSIQRAEPVVAVSGVSMRIGRGLRARIRRWFGLGRSGLRAPHVPGVR